VTGGLRSTVRSVAERLLGERQFAVYNLMEGGETPSQRLHGEAELAALIEIQRLQEGLLHAAVVRARGAGSSWDRIDELIGVTETPRGMSVGEHAFETLFPREDFRDPALRFECSTCHQLVIDRDRSRPPRGTTKRGTPTRAPGSAPRSARTRKDLRRRPRS